MLTLRWRGGVPIVVFGKILEPSPAPYRVFPTGGGGGVGRNPPTSQEFAHYPHKEKLLAADTPAKVYSPPK